MISISKKVIREVYLFFLNTYYRRIFGRFGEKTIINGKVWLVSPENIFIGNSCQIGPYCRLETFSNYGNVKSFPRLVIGDNTSMQHAVHIYCKENLVIGNGCLIASGCMITDNNHGIDPLNGHYSSQPLKSRPTILEEDVWLGENVCILAGSKVGKRSIIRSNSVVIGSIPSYSIASGNPAIVVKKFNFETEKWEKV